MPKKNTKSTRPVNPIDEALSSIYKDTEGKIPDLTSFERRRRRLVHPLLWGVIVLFILIAGASAASLYYFAPLMQEGEARTVRLLIEGPREVVSGTKATYIVTYVNEERVALNDVVIRVNVSSGLTIEQSTPKTTKGSNMWALGRLASGGHGTIEMIGATAGNAAQGISIDATLTYTRDNFSSSLVERATTQTIVKEAPVQLTLDGPDQVVVAEATKYTATIENTGDAPMTNLVLLVHLPSGVATKSLPKNAREEKSGVPNGDGQEHTIVRIPVGAVGPGDTTTLSFAVIIPKADVVKVTTTLAPTIDLRAEIAFVQRDDIYVQATTTATAEVVEGGMLVRMVTNGLAGKGTVSWNDILTTTVSYENRGKVTAENVEIRVSMLGDAIDWTTMNDAKKGVVKNGEVRWTKREIPGLQSVKAGGSGTITFSIRLRAPEDEALKGGAKDARIHTEGAMLIGRMGKATTNAVVAMTPIDIDINSDLTFRAETRYFSAENIPYGTGPLPPRVGEATTYRVFLKVKNHLHELRALDVRATLPSFVVWTGKTVVNAGEMKYDPMTREVHWTLNRMPTSVESIETQFEIRLTPLPEHGKTTVTLIPELVLTAEDGVTQGTFEQKQGPFTTALPDDPEAKGKGVVVE